MKQEDIDLTMWCVKIFSVLVVICKYADFWKVRAACLSAEYVELVRAGIITRTNFEAGGGDNGI